MVNNVLEPQTKEKLRCRKTERGWVARINVAVIFDNQIQPNVRGHGDPVAADDGRTLTPAYYAVKLITIAALGRGEAR